MVSDQTKSPQYFDSISVLCTSDGSSSSQHNTGWIVQNAINVMVDTAVVEYILIQTVKLFNFTLYIEILATYGVVWVMYIIVNNCHASSAPLVARGW